VLGLVLVPLAIGGYLLYVRTIERRGTAELEPAGALARLLLGVSVGSGLFLATMLLLWLMGVWTFTGLNSDSGLVYALIMAMLAATIEELLVRAVLFRLLEETLGSWIALALSASVFGLMHAFNPGASATSVIAIALEAGVLLAAAYMYSRRLWLVFGLHAAWNFSEGGIFATQVSGAKAQGLIGVNFNGSELLTGGSFGPEASIVAVLVCLVASATFLILAKRKGHLVAPAWKRQ
jgi:uncharacterized protein